MKEKRMHTIQTTLDKNSDYCLPYFNSRCSQVALRHWMTLLAQFVYLSITTPPSFRIALITFVVLAWTSVHHWRNHGLPTGLGHAHCAVPHSCSHSAVMILPLPVHSRHSFPRNSKGSKRSIAKSERANGGNGFYAEQCTLLQAILYIPSLARSSLPGMRIPTM